MSALLILTFLLVQTALAPLVFVPGVIGRMARAAAPWAAVPVFAVALVGSDSAPVRVWWLLIDSQFELDPVGRVFVLVAAAVWSAAGVFARGYIAPERRNGFHFFFLLTMAANLGLPITADAISFYVGFAVMTFAGYGLIVFARDDQARRAGRVYLVFAVVGEIFLLVGLLLAVNAAGSTVLTAIPRAVGVSPNAAAITICLLVGAGIKAGVVPLHVWLPLAHPVAPTPASAVLSGAMIKAGLLAWLRFLPLGYADLPGLGILGIACGTFAAVFGVVIGLLQRDLKTILAYSSISQMGVMNAAVGLGLLAPAVAPAVIAGVTVYAAQHGLSKGALFLGVGVVERRPAGTRVPAWMMVGMVLPAIALAGAPFTGGGVAKGEMKAFGYVVGPSWQPWVDWFLPLSSFATTLLMTWFVLRLRREPGGGVGGAPGLWLAIPWAALVAAAMTAVWFDPVASMVSGTPEPQPIDPAELAADALPILAGLAVAAVSVWAWRRWAGGSRLPTVEPGDVLVPLERAAARIPWRSLPRGWGFQPALSARLAEAWHRLYALSDPRDRLLRAELRLTSWPSAVMLFLAVTAVVLLLLAGRA